MTTAAPLVTVIVPIHQVADHVSACVESLKAQTHRRIEVLMVDDGSTDGSGDRALAAALGDVRFRLFRQDHAGLSAARNRGLDLATGDFIAFVDSDDRVAPEFVETMLKALLADGGDWVACAIRNEHADGSQTLHAAIHGAADPGLYSGALRFPLVTGADVIRHFPSAWNKLYRRSLIGDLRFDDGWFEDHAFYHRLAARTDHLLHLPDVLYYQTRGRPGQITETDSPRVFDQFGVLDAVLPSLRQREGGAEAAEVLASRLIYERSTSLRCPDRRAAFASASARYLAERGMTYRPDQASGIGAAWALEMAGEVPVSVILPLRPGRGDALQRSLERLAQARGPGLEVLVACGPKVDVADLQAGLPATVRVVRCASAVEGAPLAQATLQATGRYLTFLEPSDLPDPGALSEWIEAMMAAEAEVGLAAFRHGPEGTVCSGFAPGLEPPVATFRPTPQQVLGADPNMSAKIFDRRILQNREVRALPVRFGDWALTLGALLVCDRALHLPAPRFHRSPQGHPRDDLRRAGPLRLHAETARIAAAIAPHAGSLPRGWERRLYARALRIWLTEGPETGPLRRLWRAGLTALVVAGKGLGHGRGPWTAGFDADAGSRFRRLFDLPGLLRLVWRRERARLAAGGQLPDDTLAPPLDLHRQGTDLAAYSFAVDGPARAVLRVDFLDRQTAQVDLYHGDRRSVPLHLSLRPAEGRIVLNDTRSDGLWRAERVFERPLPAEGVDLVVEINGNSARIEVDGTLLCEMKPRRPWRTSGLAGLSGITHLQTRGDVVAVDLRPDCAEPLGLALDARLQLRAAGKGELRDGNGRPIPAQAFPLAEGRSGLRAILPAEAWTDIAEDEAMTLVLGDTARLCLDRSELAARIGGALDHGVPRTDTGLAVRLVEQVVAAGLGPRLGPHRLHQVRQLAIAVGLARYLEAGLPAAPVDAAAPPPAPAQSDPASDIVARFVAAARRDPPADPVLLLRDTALPPGCEARVLQALVEPFSRDPAQMAVLLEEADRRGMTPMPRLGEDSWARSAILPFLLSEGRHEELIRTLWSLCDPTPGWLVTPALAWVGDQALARTFGLDEATADQVLQALMAIIRSRAADAWGPARCRSLTAWTARLVRARPGLRDHTAEAASRFAIEVYGLSRAFWEDMAPLAADDPPEIRAAGAAFAALAAEEADARAREAALHKLADLGVAAIGEARTQYLGPAGRALPDGAALTFDHLLRIRPTPDDPEARGNAALRHLAFPASTEATCEADVRPMIERVVAAGQPDQTRSHFSDLQLRVGAELRDWITDPATALADPSAVDRVLSDLSAVSGDSCHHLGVGLALSALSGLSQNGGAAPLRRALADWLIGPACRPEPSRRLPAAVASGLLALRRHAPLEAGPVLELYRHAGEAFPDLPARQVPHLPEPDAIHDVLVLVMSCRANLGSRVPAIREGWIRQLRDLGIPHLFVVGEGEGTIDDDILHLDAPDDYEGLPLKTLAAIRWVHENTRAGHLYKVDDDCFVNAPRLFGELNWKRADYMGRRIHRQAGQTDRTWHHAKATSPRGRAEVDKSPEPSIYADGGSGYVLSRRAMQAALTVAETPAGQSLIATSFMEDKLLGDLLRLGGISLTTCRYFTSIRRRTGRDAIPVPFWNSTFHPSAAAPVHQVHMDTHLGQGDLAETLALDVLRPKKIWPTAQPPRLGYESHTLDLVSPVERVDRARQAEVAVVAVMRNESAMLPHFLAHYRALGAGAFLIADNLSDDGTRERLAEEPDVALFSVDSSYRTSHYGVAWQQAMLSAFRRGRWSVVADADELLVWQSPQRQILPDLVSGPDFEGAEAALVYMLDMYPDGPLDAADFSARPPFAAAGFADAVPFLENRLTGGPYSEQRLFTSALRHRLMPGSSHELFAAQKVALLRYQPWMQLSAGLHFVSPPRMARRELIFGHFKYNADFRRKAVEEVRRGQHFDDAAEYRRYLSLLAEGRSVIFDPILSRPWNEVPFVRARLDLE